MNEQVELTAMRAKTIVEEAKLCDQRVREAKKESYAKGWRDCREACAKQLASYAAWGFLGDVDDPIYMEALRIENMGFEAAHELRPCGHSRGDYRDPKYGTSEYDGDEKCIGCEREVRLRSLEPALADPAPEQPQSPEQAAQWAKDAENALPAPPAEC